MLLATVSVDVLAKSDVRLRVLVELAFILLALTVDAVMAPAVILLTVIDENTISMGTNLGCPGPNSVAIGNNDIS
jgi:hypothetical protein